MVSTFLTHKACAEWQLRGFYGPSRAPEVSLRSSPDGRSRWVGTGEFDGEVYVESADADTGIAVVFVGRERLVLRLASASAPTPADDDGTGSDGDASPENEKDLASSVSRRISGERLRKLLLEHPEYLSSRASSETRRAFDAAKAVIFREANEAGLRAEEAHRATSGE